MWFIHGGNSWEVSFSCFHPNSVELHSGEQERVAAFLDFAAQNPEESFLVSPGVFQDTGLILEGEIPENVILPRMFTRRADEVQRVFLNIGMRKGESAEAIAAKFPRIKDTILVCHPDVEDVATLMMEKGEGECGVLSVFPTPAFEEKYRGHSDIARNWFACIKSDAIFSWQAKASADRPWETILRYQSAIFLASKFCLPEGKPFPALAA